MQKSPFFAKPFTWDGSCAEAASTIAEIERVAQSRHVDFQALTTSSVVHASTLFRNAEMHESMMMAITAFVLRAPSGNPDFPGLIGDYVDDFDFTITFTSIADGQISFALAAEPAVAGSA